MDEINPISYAKIAIRLTGLMFLSEHEAAAYSTSKVIVPYRSPLPLDLKFGMSPAEVKTILHYAGELPLGFNFDQTFYDLKSQGKLHNENTLRIIRNKDIRLDIKFDKEGKMLNFTVDHYSEGLTRKWGEVIKNMGCSYHALPTTKAETEVNRFEKKLQRVCTS